MIDATEDCVILKENLMLQNEGCFWEYCFPCQFYEQVRKFTQNDFWFPVVMSGVLD